MISETSRLQVEHEPLGWTRKVWGPAATDMQLMQATKSNVFEVITPDFRFQIRKCSAGNTSASAIPLHVHKQLSMTEKLFVIDDSWKEF